MRASTFLAVIALAGCAQNDPNLVKRISADQALQDIATAVSNMKETLAVNNNWLNVRVCRITVSLNLSANATKDSKVGLAASGPPAPGFSIGGTYNWGATAADNRASMAFVDFHSNDTDVCPAAASTYPGEIPAPKTAAATDTQQAPAKQQSESAQKNIKQVKNPVPKPPTTHPAQCDPLDKWWQSRVSKRLSTENDAECYNRVCPGVDFR